VVIAKASRTGNCKRLNSEGISVGIIGIHGNSTSSPLNFPFKMVASMILFIIFFTGHLVTGHLVTWSLSHLVINFYERAHNNNAKFHYNHHMVQLVTWSLVTWSLITWSLSYLVKTLFARAHYNYAKFHYTHHRVQLVTWLLGDEPFWACTLQLRKISLQSPQGTAGHLVTGNLVTWSLSHLVINLSGGAHNNYAKFHYNRISGL
jgi:hypothetical protein